MLWNKKIVAYCFIICLNEIEGDMPYNQEWSIYKLYCMDDKMGKYNIKNINQLIGFCVKKWTYDYWLD